MGPSWCWGCSLRPAQGQAPKSEQGLPRTWLFGVRLSSPQPVPRYPPLLSTGQSSEHPTQPETYGGRRGADVYINSKRGDGGGCVGAVDTRRAQGPPPRLAHTKCRQPGWRGREEGKGPGAGTWGSGGLTERTTLTHRLVLSAQPPAPAPCLGCRCSAASIAPSG